MPVKTIEREPEPQALPGEAPASAGVGHNRPPIEETVAAEFREELLRDRPDFMLTLEQLVEAADRAKAEDDETLGKCGDLVKRYRALKSHIETTHKTVKQPYLDGGRAADAEKNELVDRVEAAKRKVEAIGNAFVAKREAEQRAERERIAAEQRAAAERAAEAERQRERAEAEARRAAENAANEEERRAAEQRAAEAAAEAERAMSDAALSPVVAKAEPVRSDEGATVSGKQEWQSQVTDYEVAFIAVADDEKVREAIDKAVARRVRAGTRKIEGVRIWPVAKANFR